MNIEAELKTQKELSIALASIMRLLIADLEKKGLIDVGEFVETIQKVALSHRENGEELRSQLMFHLSEHILKIPG